MSAAAERRSPGGRLRRLIESEGPISVARFMGESNARYYASRDPLGAAGDFVTAPEISQMFGELVGLWLADVWVRAGQTAGVIFAELGPGRGTLALDALRAMGTTGLHPRVHLVEGSPALRAVQGTALPAARFHSDLAGVPEDGPLLLVANEFLDALPVRQLVRTPAGWRERMVAVAHADLAFAAGRSDMRGAAADLPGDLPEGTIVETSPAAAAITGEIVHRLARQGGAALLIDYGHFESRTGSTLQAVRSHSKVDPLAHPDEADITAHVDFAPLAAVARRAGCRVQRADQGAWLTAMGIGLRAAALARALPGEAATIESARRRLVDADQMGTLFKVMAITAPSWPEGAGFTPSSL